MQNTTGDDQSGSSLPSAAILPHVTARFTFVVGKGGVGKTTTAAALALRHARRGALTHLISTDPAHSLADYFGQSLEAGQIAPHTRCEQLRLEEFGAQGFGERWLAQLRPSLAELIERGTYLDAEDARAFFDRALPGVDEVMAAFRLAELEHAPAEYIIVDTAPTGHLLRLLDAPSVIATWVDALEAMVAKAETVATALVGHAIRPDAARQVDQWRNSMVRFQAILRGADFIVVTRPDPVVAAETRRLRAELQRRGLRVAEVIELPNPAPPAPQNSARPAAPGPTATPPGSAAPASAAAPPGSAEPGLAAPPPGSAPSASAAARLGSAAAWLQAIPQRILFFAGKGGVGKSTCACAAAQVLATRRKTLLLSVDPAGSLSEVAGIEVGNVPTQLAPNLVARQLDAPVVLERWREANRTRIEEVLGSLGIAGSARLDYNVIARIWQLAPPGLDELIAFAEILDAVEDDQVVVVDAAPTGHFLRLLAMPDAATDWAHAAMRLLLKYGAVSALEDAARDLLDFARQARHLRQLLSDPERAAVFIVTLPEAMVAPETKRLQAALENATIPASAILFNRTDAGPSVPRFQSNAGQKLIRAPDVVGGITGRAGLLRFVNTWELLD